MNKDIIKIESEIQRRLGKDNNVTVHFDRYETEDGFRIDVITYNPERDEFFLLTSEEEGDVEECYAWIMGYVNNLMETLRLNERGDTSATNTGIGPSWTVEWSFDGGDLQTSYFHGRDPQEVMNKFYHGKDSIRSKYRISTIKQNPIA